MTKETGTEAPESGRLAFGPFIFDVRTGELFRDGSVVHLPPKPTAILTMLLQRPGRLVTRDELYGLGWADTVVTFDVALNAVIRQVRRVLGDEARDPRFVQTVPRRGYRFIAPVAPAAAPQLDPPTRVWGHSRARVVATVIMVALIGGASLVLFREPPSVEVLPFSVTEAGALVHTGAILEARIRGTLARQGKARLAVWESNSPSGDRERADFSIRGRLHRTDREDPWLTIEVVRTADQTVVWGGAFNPMCDRLDDPTGAIADYLSRVLIPRIS